LGSPVIFLQRARCFLSFFYLLRKYFRVVVDESLQVLRVREELEGTPALLVQLDPRAHEVRVDQLGHLVREVCQVHQEEDCQEMTDLLEGQVS